MTRLRPSLAFILILFIVSCKEAPKQETSNRAVNTPVRDTSTNTQPEVIPNAYAQVDISPMDMSYFPVDYPKLKMTRETVAPPVARVIYSRPHLQRRHFHDILKYDEPWRLGANESTEIDFYRPVTILGKKVAVGRYILYCIPHPESWTIVLNANIDTWGLKQDSSKDVQHFEIPVVRNNPSLEYFTMVFEKSATGADLVTGWDDVVARLPISF